MGPDTAPLRRHAPSAGPAVFVGVDVQVRRRCPYYALSATGACVEAGWLPAGDAAPAALRAHAERLGKGDPQGVAVGIDAPRTALPAPRAWSWNGRAGAWSAAAPTARGQGRHCEVVIASLRLANPQWTPTREQAPPWMRLGFDLFAALAGLPHVYEVFPSAAYAQFADEPSVQVPVSFALAAPGPKDMLDAALGAYVVREYLAGRGCEVGGGDGLGSIVLPRTLAPHDGGPVHDWPAHRRALA